MRKIIFKAIPALIISSGMLFAQYYDPYNYQNDYNYQNNQNNYNAYQNNNVPANNYYNNYYQEFMRTLSEEANNPNSIYYSPGFYEQYNNYNAMQGNPYQDTMNAMNWASQNYNAQPNYNADNTAQNPYQNNYYNYNGYDNTAQDSYQSGYGNYNNQGYAQFSNYETVYGKLEEQTENVLRINVNGESKLFIHGTPVVYLYEKGRNKVSLISSDELYNYTDCPMFFHSYRKTVSNIIVYLN